MWSTAWYLTDTGKPLKVSTNTFGHDEIQKGNPDWRGPFLSYEDTVAVRDAESTLPLKMLDARLVHPENPHAPRLSEIEECCEPPCTSDFTCDVHL